MTDEPLPEFRGRPVRLGVLISGGGTTLANFLEAISSGQLEAEIAVVIASRPNCGGVQRAEEHGLPCVVHSRREYAEVETFSEAVFETLREQKVELVLLAGFLSLVRIPEDFGGRVLNIHPSLIPAFCGKGWFGHHVHEGVLARGAQFSGCTVHLADNEYDHGPIVLQDVVPVHDEDTAATLAARVFEAECRAYPEAVRRYISGELTRRGNRIVRRTASQPR